MPAAYAAYVVIEGPADTEILKRCLPEQLAKAVYVAVGEEWSSAMSLAGSILVTKARPVALVVDADSEDGALIEERRDFAKSFLRRTSVGVPFEVFVAVPEFEAVLFPSKSVVERFLGKPVSDLAFEAAKRHPKKWLFEAGVRSPAELVPWLERLEDNDWATLRRHELIRQIADFLTHVIAGNGSPYGRRERVIQL